MANRGFGTPQAAKLAVEPLPTSETSKALLVETVEALFVAGEPDPRRLALAQFEEFG
jgi:hypothetical protein